MLFAASLTSVGRSADCRRFLPLISLITHAEHIFYGSGATGMALVVIDGNQRVFVVSVTHQTGQ
ncbi:hypothetical protein KCP74_24770 [Salmonella enterica subsp. enterica]|nr:hypothetical protein KCP74_24770 [Salmonella enterica subsp. enterica]